MIKIRNNIFETNSSSTHAICFGDNINKLPKTMRFNLDYFGRYDGYVDRDDYLYTAICDFYCYGNEWKDKWEWVESVLKKNGVEKIYTQKPKYDEYGWASGFHCDHSENLEDFLSAVLEDEDLLLKYLTDDDGFVHCSEDDWDVYDSCTLPHKFMKGN